MAGSSVSWDVYEQGRDGMLREREKYIAASLYIEYFPPLFILG